MFQTLIKIYFPSSPLYFDEYDVTTDLGSITYSGANVDQAKYAKMTFLLTSTDGVSTSL